MNESSSASAPGGDAELLNKIRSGDPRPAAVLRARHAAAARSLACHLTLDAADGMVATAFTQVLDAVTRGGGPSDAFRPYLLSAVRRAAHASVSRQPAPIPTDEQQIPDPGQPLLDQAADQAGSPVIAAFLSLPERWQAVLWHVEVERAEPAEVTPLLGLPAAEVTELAGRARDGLVRAYLQIQAATGSDVRVGLADAGVGDALRGAVAPLFLGGAAAAYLAERPGRAGARGADGRASGAVGATAAATWVTGKMRGSSRSQRAVAAGAGALLAVFGVGAYVLMQGQGAGTVSAGGQDAAPGVSGAARPTVTPSGLAARQPGPGGQGDRGGEPGRREPGRRPGGGSPPPTGATPMPSTTVPPSARPTISSPATSRSRPPARPAAPAAQVSAQIGIYGPGSGDIAGVAFGISDRGPAATADLTATISLPAGAVLTTSWHRSSGPPGRHGNYGHQGPPGAGGWNCHAVTDGAVCTHGPIVATARIGGVIAVRITGPAACGKYVQVTVTGGASPAMARSAGTIECGQHGRGFAADLAAYAGGRGAAANSTGTTGTGATATTGRAGRAGRAGAGISRPSRGPTEHHHGGRWLAGRWPAGRGPSGPSLRNWRPGAYQFGRSWMSRPPAFGPGGRWPGGFWRH